MRDEFLRQGAPGGCSVRAGQAGTRRRVRMTRTAGQSLVLSSLGGSFSDSGPVEIRFAEAGTGGAITLDFLLPDNIFVENKETMDGVHALFCPCPALRPGLEG